MSYAVVWCENGGTACAGSLDLGEQRLLLTGASADGPARREVAYGDLTDVWVERRPRRRLNGRPTLVVEAGEGGRITLISLGAAGSLLELTGRLDAFR
jgi:hypothetical protein